MEPFFFWATLLIKIVLAIFGVSLLLFLIGIIKHLIEIDIPCWQIQHKFFGKKKGGRKP